MGITPNITIPEEVPTFCSALCIKGEDCGFLPKVLLQAQGLSFAWDLLLILVSSGIPPRLKARLRLEGGKVIFGANDVSTQLGWFLLQLPQALLFFYH